MGQSDAVGNAYPTMGRSLISQWSTNAVDFSKKYAMVELFISSHHSPCALSFLKSSMVELWKCVIMASATAAPASAPCTPHMVPVHGPDCMITFWKSPLALGDTLSVHTATEPELCPHSVTAAGLPWNPRT